MGTDDDGATLSPDERQALLVALHRGYFETPRQVTTGALAAELDCPESELRDHLRCGMAKVFREHTGTLESHVETIRR